MKKLISLFLATVFGFASLSVMACPKGSTLTGGAGKHHKGGQCTAKTKNAVTTPAAQTK